MPDGCECEIPEIGRIRCQRHGCEKDKTQVKLCQAGGKYWQAWEACTMAGQDCFTGQVLQPLTRPVRGSIRVVRKPSDKATAGGPGTELKRLLRRVGIRPTANCRCNAHARKMDRNGIDWCERHTDTILAWLAAESSRRGLPFLRPAATAIIRLAIRRARRSVPD
jgi:hypothetical protein